MLNNLLPTLAVFRPAVAVGVLLAVYGNDAAAAITASGVLLMAGAGWRLLKSGGFIQVRDWLTPKIGIYLRPFYLGITAGIVVLAVYWAAWGWEASHLAVTGLVVDFVGIAALTYPYLELVKAEKDGDPTASGWIVSEGYSQR